MPRKYAVLKQFTQDLDRLLREAETAFEVLKTTKGATQAEILAVYHPIHSLKGICGMVEETKLLVRAFHLLEDSLPPLIPVRAVKAREKKGTKSDWTAVAHATFQMSREVERILIAKLELWKKLGADDNESRGLVVSFTHSGVTEHTWIGITGLLGLVDSTEITAETTAYVAVIGEPTGVHGENEALLIESSEGTVAVYFDEIVRTCTRLEAVQGGVPQAFKDWWTTFRKRRTSTAA